MEASEDDLQRRTYNIGGMSFTPEEIAHEIRQHIPDFKVEYKVNPLLQNIGEFFLHYTGCFFVPCPIQFNLSQWRSQGVFFGAQPTRK